MAEQLRRTKNTGLPPSQRGTRDSEIFSIYRIEVVSNGGQTEYICSLGTGDFNNASVAQALEFYLEQNSDLNLGFKIITSGIWENTYDDYIFPFNDGSGFYKVKFKSLPPGAFDTNGEYGPLFLEFIVVDMTQYEPATQIDINGLVDFSYAGYDYGNDIPTIFCDVSVDLPGCNFLTDMGGTCPDASSELQLAIDGNPGKTICIPAGLYRLDDTIQIRQDNTVLKGDGAGTYLYFKGPDIQDFEMMQHFGEECSNYNAFPDMCDSIPNCEYNELDGECESDNVFPYISVYGSEEPEALRNLISGKIVEDAPFGSNTIIVDSIYANNVSIEEIKCGDEIIILFEMTQDFLNEYNMSDANISEEDDSNIFPNGKYAVEMKTWQLGKTHKMFRRRVTREPERVPIGGLPEDQPDVPTSIIVDEDETRTGGRRPQPKRLGWKLTFDIPLRHQIKTTYKPSIYKKTKPYLKNVGLEDLFISNAYPYKYTQKKYKPYSQENNIASGQIVGFSRTKNSFIKNVNSFSPSELPGTTEIFSLMQYLYGIDYNTEFAVPNRVKEIPTKSNITNVFCELVKAKYFLDDEDFWADKICESSHDMSIWNEQDILFGFYEEGTGQNIVDAEPKVIFSEPGQPCKVMDDNYGDLDPTTIDVTEQSYMSGYPPPQFSEPIEYVEASGNLGRVRFKEEAVSRVREWFETIGADIPVSTQQNYMLPEIFRIRFHNPINSDDIGQWHNCGHYVDDSQQLGIDQYSCWTYKMESISPDFREIVFSGVQYSIYSTPSLFTPEDLNPAPNGMEVQLTIGGTTDCNGECKPNQLLYRSSEIIDGFYDFLSVQYCNPYRSFEYDASCCQCSNLDGTDLFPVESCNPPLWLGTKGDVFFYGKSIFYFVDSKPNWYDNFLETWEGERVNDLTSNHDVMTEFNEFFDNLGNPMNTPFLAAETDEIGRIGEPKHLMSSGISLNDNRNVTIKNCTLKLPQNKAGGGRGYLFNVSNGNNDILIEDCEGYRGRHNFLSAGTFSNSGIVHNRVKSSGGWFWLNETGEQPEDASQWGEYTDDEWWSRYQELEMIGIGKPGFPDNHVGLTFGSLYTDSELHDGLAWHNRLDNSDGAGVTTVNSVLWNVRGYDEVSNPDYKNMSIPGVGMIQSYNAKEGLIFLDSSYSEENQNYLYDVESVDNDGNPLDEELGVYFDYVESMLGEDYDYGIGFNQTLGILSVLGDKLIENLFKSGIVLMNIRNAEIGGFYVHYAKMTLNKNSEVVTEYNPDTNVFKVDIEGGILGELRIGSSDFYGINLFPLEVTTDCSISMEFNLDTGTLIDVDVEIEDWDVEIRGGWFPLKNFIEEVLIEWFSANLITLIAFGKTTGVAIDDVEELIEDKINDIFKSTVPVQLKKYRVSDNNFEEIYDELENTDITEASGLVHSRQYSNVFWTHNDSNVSQTLQQNVIYAFNESGEDLGTFELTGLPINQRDWEDMATDNNGNLYIGEIGDNGGNYDSYYVYKCPEPDVNNPGDYTIPCEVFPFTYDDDKSYDAETLMVDTNGDIYIITKHFGIGSNNTSRLYKLNTQLNEAEHLMNFETFPGLLELNQVTGGDISLGGQNILIRTYEKVFNYTRTSGQAIEEALSIEPTEEKYTREHPLEQGEAVAWSSNGNNYYTISEKLLPLAPLMKYMKEFVQGLVSFYGGDYRQSTLPNDTYYLQSGEWENDFPNLPSLYDIQKEIRLNLPDLEDSTSPRCDGSNFGEVTPEEDIPIVVPGCTDISACNYDPSANGNDGSCTYPTDYPHRCYVDLDGDGDYETPRIIYWCDRVFEGIPEYQSCEDYPGDYVSEGNQGLIYGCTDFMACNYMPGATEDDGSCDYGIDYSGYDSTFGYNCSHVNFIKDFIFSGNDEFYFMGNFQRFTFEHWNACYDIVNLCLRWHDNGDLKGIFLNNQPMQGFIPESIGYVNTLEKIHLMNLAMQHHGRNGTFNADLPTSIGSLTNLEILRLPGNRFGTLYSQGIPDEIGRLVNLEQLDMQPPPGSNFGLRGTIPQSMENLTNLKTLSLQRNKLEGEIPDIFGNMSNLYRIRAQDNLLEGYFPPSICNTLAADGVDDEGNSVDDSIFVARNYLCEPPPPDCLTGDEIQFDTQYFNESCYEIEIPPIIEIDP